MSVSSIALVDLSCLFKRTFMASPGSAPGRAAQVTLEEIARIESRVERVVLCLDAPPYSRKEIFSDYKAQREPPSPSEVYQKRWLYDRCKALDYKMAKVPGAEADDVIATLARIYGEMCPEVILVGADKDLAQCVTDNVRQLAPAIGERKEELRGPAEIKKKYDVWPHEIPLYLALIGDKSDNVPGVKGIGQVKASALIAEFKTFQGLAENLGRIGGAIGKNLAEGWHQLELSLRLVTLDTKLPIDAMALLERRNPAPASTMGQSTDVVFDGFMGNETPMPEPVTYDVRSVDAAIAHASRPEPIIGKDPRADEFLRQAEAERNADRAAREQQEREIARERDRQPKREKLPSEHPDFPAWPDPAFRPVQEPTRLTLELNRHAPSSGANGADESTRQAPAPDASEGFIPFGAPPAPPPAPEPEPLRPPVKAVTREPVAPPAEKAPPTTAIVKEAPNYGMVTDDLAPKDLRSAEVIAKWIHSSNLYPKFTSPAAVFTVILRSKELGIGMTTALALFHFFDGQLVAHADLIRALAIRSPKCKYFRLVHSDTKSATWETRHADHPEPTTYTYTIEEAEAAGLLRPTRNGKPSSWVVRPRDLLTKTAGSKLARIVYPGETGGAYCPEEMSGETIDTIGQEAA